MKNLLTLIALYVVLTVSGNAQNFRLTYQARLTPLTVATLPATGNWEGRLAWVEDGTSTADCTNGLSTFDALCVWDGAAWKAFGGAGGGGIADPGSNGVLVRTALNTTVGRTITGTASQVTVTNGDGVAGAPTLSLPATINVATSGNAGTATALAANPADCTANQFATTIAASGALTCAALVDADVPNTVTVDLATVATTANAGDSATAFFAAGEIEDARLPAAITRDAEIDTLAELNTVIGDDDAAGLAAAQTFATGTKTVTAKFDFGGGTLEIPNGITLPATCAVGDQFMDTDATTGQRLYLCQAANTWALQGDGGSGAVALNDLTDVDTTGQTSGDTISFNGTNWVPVDAVTPTNVVELTYKTIDGGAPRTTTTTLPTGANELPMLRHEDNCTALTGVSDGVACFEEDANTLYVCESPEGIAGICDVAGEWTATGGGGATTLDGLTDVVITAAATAEVIRHNGTNWVDAQLAFSDLSGAATDAQVPDTITVDLATVATTANAGDSATAFFAAGQIDAARLDANTVFDNVGATYTSGTHSFAAAVALVVPNSITLPATCTVGSVYADTDATSTAQFYLCTALNTWTAQGGGGAETNSLEVLTTGILTTEIPIGTAANTVVYAALSGDATMSNAGVVTVVDDLHAHTGTSISALDVADITTGTLSIARGGTSGGTQTAAMDALSPTTTKGDLLVDNGTSVIRLPVGVTNGHALVVDSVEAAGVKWAATAGGTCVVDSGGIWSASANDTFASGMMWTDENGAILGAETAVGTPAVVYSGGMAAGVKPGIGHILEACYTTNANITVYFYLVEGSVETTGAGTIDVTYRCLGDNDAFGGSSADTGADITVDYTGHTAGDLTVFSQTFTPTTCAAGEMLIVHGAYVLGTLSGSPWLVGMRVTN